MARTADGAQPRVQYVRTRITPTEKALVDTMRGSLTESAWVRELILSEARRKGLR